MVGGAGSRLYPPIAVVDACDTYCQLYTLRSRPMSEKPRVLFVDDDPTVLDALARALRPEIERYDVMYALGTAAGLTALNEFDFDIVVTDLPAVHAASGEALKVVMTSAPGPILTGDATLAKPCTSSDLRDLLARLTTAS